MKKKNQLKSTPWVVSLSGMTMLSSVAWAIEIPMLPSVKVESLLQTELPEGSSVITQQELKNNAVTRWEDLNRIEPGLHFNARNGSVNLRGMDKGRVDARLDGIRLPWLDDGARGVTGGLASLSFQSVSSVQVLRGAASHQTGQLAGGVNVLSLTPRDVLDGKSFGFIVSTDYDSADTSRGAAVAVAGELKESTRWLVQTGQRRGHELKNYGGQGGLGTSRIEANPETTRQHDVLLKLEHDLQPGHVLQLSAESFRKKSTLDNLREQGPGTSFEVGQNQTYSTTQRDRIVAGYDFTAPDPKAKLASGFVKAYWQKQRLSAEQEAWRLRDERASAIPGDPFGYGYPYGAFGRHNEVQEKNYGVLAGLTGVFAADQPIEHQWQLGMDAYRSDSEQYSGGYDNCPPNLAQRPAPMGPRSCDLLHTNQADRPEVKGRVLALWAVDRLVWDDGKYAISPSLRFDSYQYNPKSSAAYNDNPNSTVTTAGKASGSYVSPSIGFEYQATETLGLYAHYGLGYKAPNAAQLYTNYGAPGTYLRVGNPHLKAETSRGWELGAQWGDQDLGAKFSVYQNHYKNFIEDQVNITADSEAWNPAWDGLYPMGVSTAINRSRVRISGIELSAQARWQQHWYSRAGLAWARGKDTTLNQSINAIAPLKMVAALGYDSHSWGGELSLVAALKRNKVANPEASGSTPADFKAPGYGVMSLAAWWQPPAQKGLRLQAGIYNLFDKQYWEALNVPQTGGRSSAPVASYTEPGRTFKLNLTYHY